MATYVNHEEIPLHKWHAILHGEFVEGVASIYQQHFPNHAYPDGGVNKKYPKDIPVQSQYVEEEEKKKK